ncbi:MAG: tRNA (guanosine(18)-2'-O)-methyltransferase TrmH [Gemmatimonadetes bacterium]|nr:tRNA (guanosine(18)-2'-O)-methyltransferase TrmH [Gemmatimonadota bacterium]
MGPQRFHLLKATLARRQPDLTVLMDRVDKAHNFSAILRSCDAVGILEAHVVPPDEGLDVHHAASGGTAKWVAVRKHPDVPTALAHLRAAGFTVLAAHRSGEARDYRNVDFTRPTALVLGAELLGVSAEAVRTADGLVAIPMMGMVESLNVSVAAAILLYEARRQREAAGMYDVSRLGDAEARRILFEWAYPRVAKLCRRQRRPYPQLGPDGDILDEDD